MPSVLIHNLVLLIALTSFYGFFLQQFQGKPRSFKFVIGIWFGLAAIAGMMQPFELREGLFFDGRAIIIGLASFFGGWIPASISSLLSMSYRIYLGGTGVYAGVCTIIVSALLGLGVRMYYKHKVTSLRIWDYYVLGLLVSIGMLVSQFANPWDDAIWALSQIWYSILLIYPIGFILIAGLLSREERRLENEAALNESERKLRTTLYSIGDGVITTDAKGQITIMNPAAERMTGWHEIDAIGKDIDEVLVIVDKSGERTESPVRRVLREKKIVGRDSFLLLVSRDGKELPVSDSGAPIILDKERLGGAVLVLRDHSEAYQFEKEILEKEYFLSESQKAGRVGSYLLDLQTQEWKSSAVLNDIFGVDENFTKDPDAWLQLVHPEHREEVHRCLLDVAHGVYETFDKEYRIIRKSDGSVRWVHGYGILRYDNKGKAFAMLGTIQDVTEAIEARERLEKSEHKFRKLFENHSAIHMLLDPGTGRIMSANKAAAEFYGWSTEELNNMYVHQINVMEKDDIIDMMRKVKEGHLNHIEVKHRLADGRVRDVEIFSSRVDVLDEEYLYAIIHDITDKKQLVEDLVKAKEKAEESDLLKSAFMANMSHEIRTPLNGILGFTSLLTTEDPEDLPPPDKRKEYAAIIERSADNLMQLINDILDISKLDAGQMNIEKREFNLLMTLNSLELIYQKRLDDIKKDIRLRTKYPLAPMVVKGDEARLTQIFTNLLDNAVKFTDKGEIAFGIRSLSDSEISFFVSDTGKGIPREKQARIFKRFAQEDDTISRRYGGTGLGLAIVKSLLDLMGGSIRLDSTPGEGSCFEFTLPLKVDTNASAAEDRAGGEGAVSSGRLSILLVEDDPVNQLYYKEVLREPDFNLYMAPTGKEALELFKAFSPEVILLDIRLPDINGLEVARQIRATGSKVWIIGQSAYAMAGDEQAAIDAGCNEYLTKPVKASVLLKRLHTLAGLH